MDWDGVVERNREALKRIITSLVTMAGLAGGTTLPRHLHRAVLRLLRPAEAAVRRLVIVAARDLVLPPPAPQRPRKPKPKSAILRGRVGTVILLPRNVPHPEVRGEAEPRRTLCLPLTDPLPRWRRRRPVPSGIPRISLAGFGAPSPVPVRRPLSAGDPIDASRLALRLQALGRALDDLPGQARRFARWRSRLYHGQFHRISPLRPGRPPGRQPANGRRPTHEVHDVLGDLQYFAIKALEKPDTS
jgi:hypothetical protein